MWFCGCGAGNATDRVDAHSAPGPPSSLPEWSAASDALPRPQLSAARPCCGRTHTPRLQVKNLLSAAYSRAKQVLRQHEKELHALAQELIDKETLTGQQIQELLARVNGGVAVTASAKGRRSAAAPAS